MNFPYLSSKDRERLVQTILSLPPGRDHIILQVLLDGEWVDFDTARDTALDFGMQVLGIWKKRKTLSEEGTFDSLDQWLKERMQLRTVLQGRELFFRVINQVIERIRMKGNLALKAGTQKPGEPEKVG